MKRLTIDLWVGIFVLIGIASLAFLSFKVATTPDFSGGYSKNYTINANFNNIGSLKVNAPVKVSGFVVGRVTNIMLDTKTYEAIVTMEINDHYQFTTDTSAQILTTGLLGEQYISLQSGADNNYLKNGDSISTTSSAMVLEDLIGKFMTNISAKN